MVKSSYESVVKSGSRVSLEHIKVGLEWFQSMLRVASEQFKANLEQV